MRGGDQAAATELMRRYEPAVRRVARIRLGEANMQRLLDSMDICQSVFASFFVRAALGQYDIDTPEQVMHLLVAMSRRKVIDQMRGAAAERRDYRRIEAVDAEEQGCPSRDPTPSQQVATAE